MQFTKMGSANKIPQFYKNKFLNFLRQTDGIHPIILLNTYKTKKYTYYTNTKY